MHIIETNWLYPKESVLYKFDNNDKILSHIILSILSNTLEHVKLREKKIVKKKISIKIMNVLIPFDCSYHSYGDVDVGHPW